MVQKVVLFGGKGFAYPGYFQNEASQGCVRIGANARLQRLKTMYFRFKFLTKSCAGTRMDQRSPEEGLASCYYKRWSRIISY
jgi:hypothetical protein